MNRCHLTFFLALLLVSARSPANEATQRLLDGCDDAGTWSGGTLDTALKQTGAGSLRWAHGESAALTLKAAPADWTAGKAVAFWLHSAVATGSKFMVIAEAENPETEGADYYMREIRLDFTGWRRFVFDRRTFGVARKPLGWDHVTRFTMTAAGWDNTPDPQAVVHLDELELIDVTGPLMTDPELFAALDLDRPELAAVKTAVAAGDLAAAKTALAAYLRQRTSVPWWFDPHQVDRTTRFNRERADATLAGEHTEISVKHVFPNDDIDWFYNPTIARDDLPDNHEWQWQLGRMGYWGELARAWWGSGEDKYVDGFVKELRSWITNCPRPERVNNGAGSAWRTIECGIRLGGSWPNAYHRFLSSPRFTDDDLVLYLKSVTEQAAYLREFPTTGNWLTMELNGLYTTAAMFPELKEAQAWRQYAIGRLYEELDAQFLPDGAQIELTPGYAQVALDNILSLPRLAKLMNRTGELPADFIARMQKAYEYNQYLMTPDRSLPTFNDSWPVNVPGTLRITAELFPERADFAWLRSDGKEGAPPPQTSHAFPHAGYYAMRSGWEKDANYAAFDAGPLGYGHVHQDKLNLVVYAYGRELLYDNGGGQYENSPYRRYATDTYSHNCVLVDGKPQRRPDERRLNGKYEPLDNGWQTTAEYDFVRGVYDGGYGKVEDKLATHTRRVLFVKPDLFIVADTLVPADDQPHRYQARWHLLANGAEQDGQICFTVDAGRPNLGVVPLLNDGLAVDRVAGQLEPELLGWNVHKNGQNDPTVTITHTREGTGVQQLLTLLMPLKDDAVPGIAKIEGAGTTATVTLADGRRWVIEADSDPARGVRFRETLANGQAGRSVAGG